MSEEQMSTDSWDGLLGNYLKAEDVKEKEGKFPIIGVRAFSDEGEVKVQLDVEVGSFKKIWDLNMTNRTACKASGFTPKEMIGKFVYWEKSKAMNPSLKKEVPVLRVVKVASE